MASAEPTEPLARRLLLFDIDGTLLTCGPQVRPLFAAALHETWGTVGALEEYDFAGRTDPQIVYDLMGAAGVPRGEIHAGLPLMQRRYLDALEQRLDAAAMTLLPGVGPLLDDLAARPEVALGLVTGNWERGARAKLGRLGLAEYFRFGAFGDDGVERGELPPVALARATRVVGRPFSPAEALVIGDSVYDVRCALDNGLPVLAVTTGRTSADRLRAAGATWVVEHLAGLADELVGRVGEVGRDAPRR